MVYSTKEYKAQIRKEAIARRDSLSESNRWAYAYALVRVAECSLTLPSGAFVGGFWPLHSEIDIRPLMMMLYAKGARLCFPVQEEKNTMIFRLFFPGSPVVSTGWGTFGPPPTSPQVEPDILLLPLLAFDKIGTRLGYGLGCYDRFIAQQREIGRKMQLMGVGFDSQYYEYLPFEDHDVRMDYMLTQTLFKSFDGT